MGSSCGSAWPEPWAPPARIRGLTGRLPASGLPVPQTVEQAGTVLDGLVRTPNFRG